MWRFEYDIHLTNQKAERKGKTQAQAHTPHQALTLKEMHKHSEGHGAQVVSLRGLSSGTLGVKLIRRRPWQGSLTSAM